MHTATRENAQQSTPNAQPRRAAPRRSTWMLNVERWTLNVFRPPASHAFTLIELLASIAILMMIVSIMGVIFAESDRAWRLGTARADVNMEGRAAVNAIANDVQYALADNILTFITRVDNTRSGGEMKSYGFTNSELCCVILQGDAESGANRSARQVYYWVREMTENDNQDGTPLGRFELMRTEITTFDGTNSATHAYKDKHWYNDEGNRSSFLGRGAIAENVAAVAFYAPDNSGTLVRDYNSESFGNRLPAFLDIVVSVLSDEDAERASDLSRRFGPESAKVGQFIERNARRYTSRVYFQNRAGYKVRW